MIGETILHYKILQNLGEGGMGVVYLAENINNSQTVAFKMLKLEYANVPKIRQRFLAEAKSLKQLNHENIVRIIETIDAGDVVAFTMEYIDGQSLSDILKVEKRLSDEVILDYLQQILSGLNHVHSKGLIHRDTKPSNIMITKSGSVKLLDFGIAKNTDDTLLDYTQTKEFERMGTLGYMSPEQLKNTKNVTYRTDIYSLGVVLYEMIAGKKLYDYHTLSEAEIHAAILYEKLPKTHTNWDKYIQRATAKDENDRYRNCDDWLKQLKQENTHLNVTKGNNFKWKRALFFIALILAIFLYRIIAPAPFAHKPITNSEQELINEEPSFDEVKIGSTIWMKQNWAATTFLNGDPIREISSKEEWVDAAKKGEPAFCYYEFDEDNKESYALFYNHYALTDPRGLVPKEWLIPTIEQLQQAVTAKPEEFKRRGIINMEGEFNSAGRFGMYWSISPDISNVGKAKMLLISEDKTISSYSDLRGMGMSLKCIKIQKVKIGEQVWMSENLSVVRFRNGDVIQEAQTPEEWKAACSSGKTAWCYYGGDSTNGIKYGRLYNFYAVNDPRGLAPDGWHIATNEEWDNLSIAVKEGFFLKSKKGWYLDGNGPDKHGFKALPGGYRMSNGEFKDLGYIGMWYTATLNDKETAKKRDLSYDKRTLGEGFNNFNAGFYVRCVKD
jgi:uncharacterized protein (TIGR02145 family)